MSRSEKSRRDFIKAASAAVMSGSIAATARPDTRAAAKVLNYSPSMNYRRLGKTEFMISEIALGGTGPEEKRRNDRDEGFWGGIGIRAQIPAAPLGHARDRCRAHALLKEKLQDKRISAIIPGVKIPVHLDENVKATHERDVPTNTEEDQAVRQCKEGFYANLTPQYQWLRKWELV